MGGTSELLLRALVRLVAPFALALGCANNCVTTDERDSQGPPNGQAASSTVAEAGRSGTPSVAEETGEVARVLSAKGSASSYRAATGGAGSVAAVAVPGCQAGMVQIPAGKFEGTRVGPFCMDLTEVTVQLFGDCVSAQKCTAPASDDECNWGVAARARHPVNCITQAQAGAFCAWMSKRLPTDDEWQWAASGHGANNPFPWGTTEPND